MVDVGVLRDPEETRIESGICPYCGQVFNIPFTVECLTYAEANDFAAEKCDCTEAKRQRAARRADKKIDALFTEFLEDTRDFLKNAGRAVIDGDVGAVSIKLDSFTSVTIKENSKGLIVISKIRKTAKQETIG